MTVPGTVPTKAPRPPLRQNNTPDGQDGARIAYALKKWKEQDVALIARDRMVEECLRFLVGQQWTAWSDIMQRFVDVTDFLSEEERRWRQRPTFNRLMPWYMINHSRMTENPPIVTFLPGPDRTDAELASTMDTIFKTLWREIGMQDVVDRVMGWLLVGGSAYVSSRIDTFRGPPKIWTGQGEVPVFQQGQDTGETTPLAETPFTKEGRPAVALELATGEYVPIGEPHSEPEGSLIVDVYSPLEVRSEWGPEPFHLKRWHLTKSFLPPEVVEETWGVPVAPSGTPGGSGTYLSRVMFGGGWWGASSNQPGSQSTNKPQLEMAEVYTLWEAPCNFPGMEITMDSPGGRLLVVSGDRVLFDGPRPLKYKYTSPIKRFDFARIPGRPHGTTPLEIMLQPQRSYNRGWSQILEHRNLVTNPKMILDQGSGLQHTIITNKPGEKIIANRRANVPPFEWASPPALGGDVYQTQQMLLNELLEYGNVKGTGGESPTADASGELVKELRFNTDRVLGPTMKRAVEEFARMVEDWLVILPVLWDQPKLIQYAGEDNVAKTITVLPEMFEQGFIHVIPDIESMLPEGRSERQQKMYRLWQDGVWGDPVSPEAQKVILEQMRFPNLSRQNRPGGIHRTMAEQFLGMLLQGTPNAELPWFPWYNPMVHLEVFEEFMSGPAYLKLDQMQQSELGDRWKMISELVQQIQAAQAAAEAEQAEGEGPAEEAAEGGQEEPGQPPTQ